MDYRCEIGIGDLQSKEERDILVVMKIADSAEKVLSCELKYFNVISNKEVSVACDLTLQRSKVQLKYVTHLKLLS